MLLGLNGVFFVTVYVRTPLISVRPALVQNSLCRGRMKRTMRESEVQIGNSGLYLCHARIHGTASQLRALAHESR
jgi:hypothetical protein